MIPYDAFARTSGFFCSLAVTLLLPRQNWSLHDAVVILHLLECRKVVYDVIPSMVSQFYVYAHHVPCRQQNEEA
jgi:hypothetical protein